MEKSEWLVIKGVQNVDVHPYIYNKCAVTNLITLFQISLEI